MASVPGDVLKPLAGNGLPDQFYVSENFIPGYPRSIASQNAWLLDSHQASDSSWPLMWTGLCDAPLFGFVLEASLEFLKAPLSFRNRSIV